MPVVRMQIRPKPVGPTRPRLLDAWIRHPWLARVGIAIILRLPQGRLRLVVLSYSAQLAGDANSRRDLDALRMLASPRFEARFAPELLAVLGYETEVVHGPDAAAQLWEEWYEAWGDFVISPEAVYDFGDGRLLALNYMQGKGASSGVALPAREEAELWEFGTDGNAIRFRQWLSWPDARKALGIADGVASS